MLASFLMGAVAGARSMTPLAAVSLAQLASKVAPDAGAQRWLGHPIVATGATVLAGLELAGDKMHSAPDRTVPVGMAARLVTGAIAGAAVAPKNERALAAAVGAGAAVLAAYVTFEARMRALRKYGQMRSGLVEDAIVLTSAALIAGAARPSSSGQLSAH